MEILNRLQQLDLGRYPYEEAKSLIKQLFTFYSMGYTLRKGSTVLRARPNIGINPFNQPKDLSYKPQNSNTTYQRASTPHKTVFYGGLFPNRAKFTDVRLICCAETSYLVRKASALREGDDIPINIETQIMTFGKWEFTKDLDVIAIFGHEAYADRHPETKSIRDAFYNYLQSIPQEQQETSIAINNFFAQEFAKEEISADHDYLLSAIFTEVAIEQGYAGVLYPSVRVGGEGFNVAIAPEYVGKHLRLTAAGESIIYSKGKKHFISNHSWTVIHPGQKKFTLHSLKGSRRFTEEQVIIDHLNRS